MSVKIIKVMEDVLGANDVLARKNRERLDRNGTLAINIMSSPGAGKTSFILQTMARLKQEISIAVIEGDIACSIDAEKVSEQGIPAVQINTGGGCHLDANMLDKALNVLDLKGLELLLIENVGNLVCPAEFNLGEHKRVMLLSLPEGDDKPHKYPLMFSTSDVVLVNKIDLLPYLHFDLDAFRRAVTGLNPDVKIMPVSCTTGEGLETWLDWLRSEISRRKGVKA